MSQLSAHVSRPSCDACHALAASGVPDSLEHGDLTADEVILGEMGPVFLDWSDGSITHPFLSAASLLADANGERRRWRGISRSVAGGSGIVTEAAGRRALTLARRPSCRCTSLALYADRVLPALGTGARSDPKVIRAHSGRSIRAMTRQRIPDEVLPAAHARARHGPPGDWAEADRLRGEIEAAGWKIADRGTDFALTPAAPADLADGERVRYGSSASVPSASRGAVDGPCHGRADRHGLAR